MKSIISLLFLILLVCQSTAQTGSVDIDTVSVTTTSIPLKLHQTGRNITVLDAEDIQKLSFNSLDEVLQTVSGVEVQSRGGFGAQADILLRGSTFTQVLILLDGQRMNDPLTGHFNGYLPVTPAEIYRIEVLRGPASAIYGPDAVGGVINILTHTFAKQNSDVIQNKGSFGYGDNALINAEHGFFSRKNGLKIGGGFNISKSDGEVIEAQIIDSTTTLEEYNTFFDTKQASISLGYNFGNGLSIAARTAYDDRAYNARYFYTSSPFDKSEEFTKVWWNQIRLSKIADKSSTSLDLSYRRNNDVFVFSPDFPSTNTHTTQFLNANLTHLRSIGNDLSLKVGLQGDQRKIESNDRGNHENLHFGAFSMVQYSNPKGLNASVGLRLDYDDNYEFEFSPQLNISYVLSDFVLRAAAGKSIRAGDYTERFVSNNLENLTPGRSLGNPDLLAEEAWSQEIGLDYRGVQNLQVAVTAFSRQSSSLIDYVETEEADIREIGSLQEDASYFLATNVSAVTTSGFEAEIYYTKTWAEKNQIKIGLGYTFLNTTNEEDVISVYISSHARHLVTSNIYLQMDRFYFALNSLFKDRPDQIASGINSELVQSYLLHNAKLGMHVTQNFGLFVQVHNLGDIEYQNILGARMPGRWFKAGIHWSL